MHKTIFLSKRQLTETIWEFCFSKPPGYEYLAGQATKLALPGVEDPLGTSRWLSFASAPEEAEIKFITRINSRSSQYKHALLEYKDGSGALLDSPLGAFMLPIRTTVPIVGVASGVGIAPFRSLLVSSSLHNKRYTCKLLLRAQHETDVPYVSELENLSESIQIAAKDTPSFTVDDILPTAIEYYSKTPHVYYVAGTQAFVDRIRDGLYESGIPEHRVVTDPYHGYEEDDKAHKLL